MLKNYKHKAITDSENQMDSENQIDEQLEEYHFAGGLEYEPITIQARTREEAEEIWQTKRSKINKAE